VDDHLADCRRCSGARREIEREQEFYLRCEPAIDVSPSFWSGVSLQSSEGPDSIPARGLSSRVFSLLERFASLRLTAAMTALIVAIAIGATVAVMKLNDSRERGADNIQAAKSDSGKAASPEAPGERVEESREGKEDVSDNREQSRPADRARPRRSGGTSIDRLVKEAEQKYLTAIAILSRDIGRRRSRMDSKTAAQFERSLAAIDRAIADTRRAARRSPDDPVAVQYMLSAYAKKVELLSDMANN
jgi:hypothetical protein